MSANEDLVECDRCGCEVSRLDCRTNVSNETVCCDCWGSGDDDIDEED